MDTTTLLFCCRDCANFVVLEIGPEIANSQAVTWYCRYCGAPETADLGASLVAIRANLAPSPDARLNPKAAAVAEESRRRKAEHDTKAREEERARRAAPMPDSFSLPIYCEACSQMLIVDIGRPLTQSRPVTWQCPHCGAAATDDLGADLLGVRADDPSPSPPDAAINYKAAVAVTTSHMRHIRKQIEAETYWDVVRRPDE